MPWTRADFAIGGYVGVTRLINLADCRLLATVICRGVDVVGAESGAVVGGGAAGTANGMAGAFN